MVHHTEFSFADKSESTNGDCATPCCQRNGSAVQNVDSRIDPNQQNVTLQTRETRPSKMEIYHHWIMIVHMAKWKDLTKWNEENTIIDWIIHMGRIVKFVLPAPSRLWREGSTYE